MGSQLLTILGAAALLAGGNLAATSAETRSADALPGVRAPLQTAAHLAAAHPAARVSTGNCSPAASRAGSAITSCTDELAQGAANYDDDGRHHHEGFWDSPAALGIGALIVVGAIVGVVATNDHSQPVTPAPVSQ